MGPIQAALNQLTGSILGGVRNVAVMGKAVSKLKKEDIETLKASEKVQGVAPTSETADFQAKLQMASPHIRGVSPRVRSGGRFKADEAALSGNDLIMQKSRASFDIASRLSDIGGMK